MINNTIDFTLRNNSRISITCWFALLGAAPWDILLFLAPQAGQNFPPSSLLLGVFQAAGTWRHGYWRRPAGSCASECWAGIQLLWLTSSVCSRPARPPLCRSSASNFKSARQLWWNVVEGCSTALPQRPVSLKGAQHCTFYQERFRRLNNNSDVVVFTRSVKPSLFSKPEEETTHWSLSLA